MDSMKKLLQAVVPIVVGVYLISLVYNVHEVEAQRSDTVFQQVFKDLSKAPTNSVDVRNIGQSQHIIYVLAKDAPKKSCATPHVADITIDASYDGTHYFPLSAGTVHGLFSTALPNLSARTGILFATGLAPHIRVGVNSFDTVDCTLDIFYAGSLYPVYIDKMENSLTAQGLRTGRFENNKKGTYTLATKSATHPSDAIAVYGIACSASGDVILQFATGATETENFYLAENSTLVLPHGGIPWTVIDPNVDFTINLSADVGVSCWYQWRYE